MNLFGSPAADGVATMQENLQQPDDPCIVDFDSRIADRAGQDGQGKPLQQRKIHMDIEGLSLEISEAVRDGLEPFPHGVEMTQVLLQPEVAQVVGAKLVAEEA